MSVRPAKTQISLGIHPVWSESSLCAQCVAKDPMLLYANSEDSDQTGHTAILLVLSCRGSYTLGPKYPRYMYTRTYKQYTHVYWVQEIHERINICYLEKKNCFCFVLKKNIFWLSDCEKKKISVFLSEENENFEGKKQPLPLPPENGRSLNRFSRDVAHMVSCYFLVYFHCNKQYKEANKTDWHPRYPFFHCHLYRHYRNSSYVSCRVILTCAKIRFVLKLDLR